MKKIVWRVLPVFFCILLYVAAIWGCSIWDLSGENEKESSGRRGHYVALITKSTTSAFWKSVCSGASAAATEYNLTLKIEGPENEEDYEAQNEMIEKAVGEGAEVIVFSAIDYNASTNTINEAVKQGVKVVVIDSDVNSNQVSCRIGTDNYLAGSMAGEAVLACEKEVLNIGLVNFDKNSENGQQREFGFRETVTEDRRANIIKTINVISNTANAKEGTKKLLEEHPEINVIATFNEWTSLGVGYAIKELDLGEEMTVVAFDNNVISVWMLENGEVDALIVQNPFAMGYLGIECAYRLINGIALGADVINTETTLVTRENMFEEECQRILFVFD